MSALIMTDEELKGAIRIAKRLQNVPEDMLPMLLMMVDSFISGINVARSEPARRKNGKSPKVTNEKKEEGNNDVFV